MLKKIIVYILAGILGVSFISCGREKQSLKEVVVSLQKAGAASISNDSISINLVDNTGNTDINSFSKDIGILYDIDGDMIGDAYINIIDTHVYKNIAEDSYIIQDDKGNLICVTLTEAGEEPKCPAGMSASKVN